MFRPIDVNEYINSNLPETIRPTIVIFSARTDIAQSYKLVLYQGIPGD
jgi:hypothetical protein